MKTSGVVVGESFTRTAVASGVGARFTDRSHARVTIMNKERNRKNFLMRHDPFSLDHSNPR
jgi:hypothetical protein